VQAVFKEGPIPALVHSVVEYAAGLLFILAPFLFDFDSSAATALSIAVGVVVIVVTASSDLPLGIVGSISRPAHAVFDVVLSVLLIISPFLFGFSDETAPTVPFITIGLLHLLITIGTHFGRSAGRPGKPESTSPGSNGPHGPASPGR
jgi:hypothetical protein